MDRLQIDYAVCSDHRTLFEGIASGTKLLGELFERSRGRIHFLGVYNPHEAARDLVALENAVSHRGFCGIKIHPSFHGVPADDARYRAVWELAARRHLPILAHSWSVSEHNPAQALSTPGRFESYIADFPAVSLILAHAGGRAGGRQEVIELISRYTNVYTDYAGDIYDHRLLESLTDSLPAERILFGSDFPWLDPRTNLARTFLSDLSDGVKERILGLNALKLYGIGGG
jgi:predicted TIM-barrel fold metal-dependent hydrolase